MGDGAAKLVNGCGVVGFLMVLVCFVWVFLMGDFRDE
jgi:TM2 domain-containing membrane protein YozV